VPAGALIVVLACYSESSGPLVSITDLDLQDYTIEAPETDGTMEYSWAFFIGAAADATNVITATFTGSGGFGSLSVWVVPISGGTCVFDVLAAIKVMSGTGNQVSEPFNTTGDDEIAFTGIFDRNGVAGSSPWTAISPAVLDNGDFASTRAAAGHQTYSAPTTGATIGLSNTGGPLGGITAIAFKAAAPPTFSISGSLGSAGAGATVSYSGEETGSVTADGSGNYTIDDLPDGDYVITPTLAGFAFTPTHRDETISGGDLSGVDFTASKATARSTRSK
jgi:hypothetical protein